MTLYDQFIKDVHENPNDHCKYVKLAVARHERDLKKDWKYKFDRDKADRVIKIVKTLKHTKGSFLGKPFDLQPFQAFWIAMVFGWVNKITGFRRFKKTYTEMARGGGKSEFMAAIMMYMNYFDKEGAPVGIIAATKWDQAKYVYDPIVAMCKMLSKDWPPFAKKCRLKQYEIIETETSGYITKMSGDASTEDGGNPHCVTVDEFHAHDDDSNLKINETGAGKRDQALVNIITTAGFNKQSACYNQRKVVIDILEQKVDNETLFGIIWTLDEGDDWKDPTKWKKPNPNLGNSPKLEAFESQFQNAITEGASAEVEFKTKNLNMWVDAAKVWISDENWLKCINKRNRPDLYGQEVIIGIDLSSRVDITSVTYFFPSLMYFYNNYYCPMDKITSGRRNDGVDYLEWSAKKYIKGTPGNVIDYDYIINDILDAGTNFRIKMIGYDPYNADLVIPKFTEQNIECGAIRQGYLTMSPATKKLEMLVLNKEIQHEGDPITRWMMGNVEISMDAAGNIKPDKGKSSNKIDGVSSLVTALATFMHLEITGDKELTMDDLKKMYG